MIPNNIPKEIIEAWAVVNKAPLNIKEWSEAHQLIYQSGYSIKDLDKKLLSSKERRERKEREEKYKKALFNQYERAMKRKAKTQ